MKHKIVEIDIIQIDRFGNGLKNNINFCREFEKDDPIVRNYTCVTRSSFYRAQRAQLKLFEKGQRNED